MVLLPISWEKGFKCLFFNDFIFDFQHPLDLPDISDEVLTGFPY